MKLAGILLILFASVIIGFILEREAGEGTRQLSSFSAFLSTLRRRLECYLDSPEQIARDYRDPNLEKTGFLESLRRGRSIREAYLESRGALSIPSEADRILSDFFASFGRGYLTSELHTVENALVSIEKALSEESKNARLKGRAMKIAAPTLGLGLVILII